MASNSFWAGAVGFGVGAFTSYLLSQQQNVAALPAAPAAAAGGAAAASSSSSSSSSGAPAAGSGTVRLPLPLRETKNNPSLSVETMMNKQNIYDVKDWDLKRVLMRVDYNVKVKKGVVGDRTRIETTIDTLKYLLSKHVKCIILLTHLGRPAPGSPNFDRKEFTLEPVANVLQEYLPNNKVQFIPETVGANVEAAIAGCAQGTVFVLENLRYHAEETGLRIVVEEGTGALKKVKVPYAEKAAFRAQLSRLGDIFVFEAFGAAHRPHSSVIGIDCNTRCAGLLMYREMSTFGRVLGQPERPFVAIIGGAKVSDKILVLENLLDVVDEMIIGGGMTYTFKRVLDNVEIGASLFDEHGASIVSRIVDKARKKGIPLHLPVDHIIADKFAADARIGVTDDRMGIPKGWLGLDIGPQSRAKNSEVIGRAKTIIWNGPLGVFEMGAFSAGTVSAMWDVVQATKRGATTVIGGGDTGSASKAFFVGGKAVGDQVSHLSTGGGSSLVLMEGKMLPAVLYMSNKGESKPNPPDEKTEPLDEGDD